jgi:hypothetical protein
MTKTYPKVASAISILDRAGWDVHPTNNDAILRADKLGVQDEIWLYRNGNVTSEGWSTVAVIEVRPKGQRGGGVFANSVAQAIKIAGPMRPA